MDCTWVCEPGTCTSCSSANFLLAGLVLLAHAGPRAPSWRDLDQHLLLGKHAPIVVPCGGDPAATGTTAAEAMVQNTRHVMTAAT